MMKTPTRYALSTMRRRDLLITGALAAAGGLLAEDAVARDEDRPGLEERGIAELQAEMQGGKLSSRALVRFYLRRIEALDRRGPALRSVLEVNPDVF
jgi:amidase